MGGRLVYGLAIGAMLVAATLIRLFDPAPIARLRLLAFDTFQQITPRQPDRAYPVRIIDIDEASIAAIGQWPWRRDVMARLVDRLHALGARVIAFDLVFPDANRDPIADLPLSLRNDPELQPLIHKLKTLPSSDKLFAEALRGRPVVLGVIGRAGVAGKPIVPRAGFAMLGTAPDRYVPSFAGLTANLPALQEAAAGFGALNWFPEHDQVVRKVPMLVRVGGQLLPSLTAEAMRLSLGARTIVVRSSTAGGETGFGGETGITSIRIGNIRVPTDHSGQVWLSFTPHDQERFRSAADVLAGRIKRSDIEGRIVVIGTSAPGLFDLRATPLDAALAGVEVHAQALEQMLFGRPLLRPDYSAGMEIAFMIVSGLVLAMFVYRAGAFAGALLGANTMSVVLAGAWWAYAGHGVLLDPVYPGLTLTGIYIFGTVFFYFQTERERNRVRQAFSHYMAPSLVERLTREPGRLQLGGETRELTIMFSDVLGFTAIAEGYRDNPRGLTQLMNRLLTPLTNAIIERQGTIDKYMGDAIMAFWNAPLDDAAHARNACESALDMMARLQHLNGERRAEAESSGAAFQPLRLGIGLCTGEAVVGNMGSDLRFDYSVLGDTVNIASRLEGLSRHYGTSILIAEETALSGASHLATIEVDFVRVKGREDSERIWAIVGDADLAADAEFKAFAGRLAEAMALYRQQKWAAAAHAFTGLTSAANQFQLDGLLSCFTERIATFSAEPPPPDWDGVWVMTQK